MADRTLAGLLSANAPALEGGANLARAGSDGGIYVPAPPTPTYRKGYHAALGVPVSRYIDVTHVVPPPPTVHSSSQQVAFSGTYAAPFFVDRPCYLYTYAWYPVLSTSGPVISAALHRYQVEDPTQTALVKFWGTAAIGSSAVTSGAAFTGTNRPLLSPDVMYLWVFNIGLTGTATSVNAMAINSPGSVVSTLGHLVSRTDPPTVADFTFPAVLGYSAWNLGAGVNPAAASITLGDSYSTFPFFFLTLQK